MKYRPRDDRAIAHATLLKALSACTVIPVPKYFFVIRKVRAMDDGYLSLNSFTPCASFPSMISRCNKIPDSPSHKLFSSAPTPSGFLTILVLCGRTKMHSKESYPLHALIHSSITMLPDAYMFFSLVALNALRKGRIGIHGSCRKTNCY